MCDIDIIHCLNIKFAEIIINNFALFSVKIKEKNAKIYSIKRNGRLTTRLSICVFRRAGAYRRYVNGHSEDFG